MPTQAPIAEQPPTTEEEASLLTKEAEANKIIRQNVVWALGGGVLPIPLVDMIAITAVNVKMVKELAQVFGLPFKEDQVKSLLASLLAGLGAPTLGMALTVSLVKSVPVVGGLSAVVAVPALSGAFTYAVGKVFLQHFAAGGTFLDFDPKRVRQHFAREFHEGKLVASRVRHETPPAAPTP
ncbi:MAG: DUF697 domain-containing protein [Verrucomicrobia bacterium]|nr:DUF697 domain-containing protein [Verrucomicrobiota bacterium]